MISGDTSPGMVFLAPSGGRVPWCDGTEVVVWVPEVSPLAHGERDRERLALTGGGVIARVAS
jgi:hypothetical protein